MKKCKFKPITTDALGSENSVLEKLIERTNEFQESTPGCQIVSVSHTMSSPGDLHFKGTALISYYETESAIKDDRDGD